MRGLDIVGGGAATLNTGDTNLNVFLFSQANLTLSRMSMVDTSGSTGADQITALSSGQALTGEAGEVPWADPTKALLDQMRFRSIAGWLPAGEAAGLRAAFQGELLRLYGPEPEDEGLLAE